MAPHRIAFSLLILLIPIQLGFHWWPEWAYVLGRRIDYLSPTIYGSDVMLVILMALWAPAALRPFRNQAALKVLVYLLLILCVALINSSYAVSLPIAASKWIKALELLSLTLYVVYTNVRWADIVLPLAMGVAYASVLGIAQALLQHSVGGWMWILGERTFTAITPGIARFNYCGPSPLSATGCTLILRAYAAFPHPNVFGGFLATALPLIAVRTAAEWQKTKHAASVIRRILYTCTVMLGLTALVFTFSRSAWVAAAFGIIFVYPLLVGKRMHAVPPSVVAAFVLIAVSLLGLVWVFRPSADDESVFLRTQLNTAAISMWRDNPIAGAGLGNFIVRLPEYTPVRTVGFLQPVHNVYLLLLAEAGLLAAAVAVGLVAVLLYRLVKTRHITEMLSPAIVPLILIGLIGFVDHYPATLQQGQLLSALYAGLAIGEVRRKTAASR